MRQLFSATFVHSSLATFALLLPLSAADFVGAPEPPKTTNHEPLTVQEERTSFTLSPGFEIEPIASESEGIGKFVTIDWDTQGRMWSMTALEYPVDANENPAAAKALYSSFAKDKVLVWDRGLVGKPGVFADGLAIPLGILPYKNGVYVQHGPDIVFLSDTDGDGKADKREVVLTGFGVQDSHLFPHQFTRAPGNWIWMAQGAFNYGKVRTSKGAEQQFDQTRMARFRYDGSEFDITSQGPCNIWGLVINGEGEVFIQEANDYGYPVMPFHMYANYPGCSDAQWKSYAPEFPGTAPDFRMGGTGLSGLALSDANAAWPAPYADVMYVANPIIRKIQAIKIHRDGPRYRLEKLPDFIQSSDEMFRPVSIKTGPDGCLYIVDWYNKIISHNEVPRNHPDRDKKRGRIWRVKHRDQKPFTVPDFTTLSGDELITKLGGDSLAQSHLAWQAITDRQLTNLVPKLRALVAAEVTRLKSSNAKTPAAARIASLWALEGLRATDGAILTPLLRDSNRNVRREAVRAFGGANIPAQSAIAAIESLAEDPDPEVRAEVMRTAGLFVGAEPTAVALCMKMARPSLPEPLGKSTHSGRTIKLREAYEREFERYLVRLFLEKQPKPIALYLDSVAAASLPFESRMLASLALEPKMSASRVARLFPELSRLPNEEELLRLAQFPEEPGVTGALERVLSKPEVLEAVLKVRTRFDGTKVAPLIIDAARGLWNGDARERALALRLTSAFKLSEVESELHEALLDSGQSSKPEMIAILRTIRELGANHLEALVTFIKSPDREIANEALLALASSRNRLASDFLLKKFWNDFDLPQRKTVLASLSSTKAGAQAIVKAVNAGGVEKADLDNATLDKLATVLHDDTDFAALVEKMSLRLRPALRLNGGDDDWLDSDITLDGAFTVETWVKLDPGINNSDGILGSPGLLDINFHDAKLRVWVGGEIHDAIIANKKIVADSWTHVAVARDASGKFRLYQNGELDTDQCKLAPQKFEHCRIGWTAPPKGTAGWLTEFRVWNRTRSADEIRVDFDHSYEGETMPPGLIRCFSGEHWPKLHGSARVEKTSEFPPLLTATEAHAQAQKFAQFRALTDKPGDVKLGQTLFTTTCMTCHNVGGPGAQIGPVLNGAGAMGIEALLRAVLTPNAAMEGGYRVFRVELKDGDVADGLLVSQNDEAIVLRRPNSDDLRIPQKNVRRAYFTKVSMMPEGLLEAFKPEDVSNLFAYLRTLK
jgi:putative membrane-bound dehydrogenase-like protein